MVNGEATPSELDLNIAKRVRHLSGPGFHTCPTRFASSDERVTYDRSRELLDGAVVGGLVGRPEVEREYWPAGVLPLKQLLRPDHDRVLALPTVRSREFDDVLRLKDCWRSRYPLDPPNTTPGPLVAVLCLDQLRVVRRPKPGRAQTRAASGRKNEDKGEETNHPVRLTSAAHLRHARLTTHEREAHA